MCGRFQASRAPAEVARWFKTIGPPPNLRQRYNAAPSGSQEPAAMAWRQIASRYERSARLR